MDERRPIVVTGASRGVGLELVRHLVAQGQPVIGIAREAPDLQDPLFRFISCDLSDRGAISALVQNLVQQNPGGLVNNAAVQTEGDTVTLSTAAIAAYIGKELEVNLAAPLILSTALMPVIAKGPEGFICNINSCLALAPKTAAPAYCAAKAGLSNATFALHELARAWPGLLVSEVLLPLVDTDMTAGRGKGKISATQAAKGILDGLARRRTAIRIGGARVLYALWRLSPNLARMVLRGARPGQAGHVRRVGS